MREFVYVPSADAAATRIGPWLSETFERFTDAWQVWCVQGLITLVGTLLPAVVVVAVLLPQFVETLDAMQSLDDLSRDAVASELVADSYLFVLLLFVTLPVHVLFQTGMLRTAAKQLRGEEIAVGDLFDTGGRYLPALALVALVQFLVTLISVVCAPCLFFPTLVVLGLWFFAHPLVVEAGMGPLTALDTSFRTTRSHWIYYGLFWLVLSLIAQAGGLLLGVGVALSLPLVPIATMIAHRDVFLTSAHLDPSITDEINTGELHGF